MCCITLLATPAAVTTKQLAREVCYRIRWQNQPSADRRPLSMRWIVVTDELGKRQLQLRWSAESDSQEANTQADAVTVP